MNKTTTLSFRTTSAFADETDHFARSIRINKTEYLEQAVREKNERILADRMRFLSERLAEQSLSACKDMEDADGDDLA